MAGPADMQIDPHFRRAFISSIGNEDDKRTNRPRGGVYVFSIDDPLSDDAFRDRTDGAPARFEPVGLSYFDNGVERRLFVANAAAKSVELFDVDEEGDLQFIESFRERRLSSPSDVVAVGPRSFYVTSEADAGRNSVLGKAHYLLRFASGRVLHFDGTAWRVAAENLKFADGLALSRDGKRLYVAESAGAALRIFDRDAMTGALTPALRVPLGAAPQNLNVDRTGSVWIGARAKSILPSETSGDASTSLVIRFDDIVGVASKPKPVFADSGERIKATTVAARLGPTLMIGSPVEKKFLICEMR
jgi:arylesterase/paraoxonase